MKILIIKLPLNNLKDYLSRYCEVLELSLDVENRARELCDEIENNGLKKSKSPTTIAAAVLYLSSLEFDEKRLKLILLN